QNSTGPKTPEGKERSKLNALKHGMTAKTTVLPGEDPAAFQHRVDHWKADLQAQNAVEDYLIEQAAQVSWRLDRVNRTQTVRLAQNIRTAAAEQARQRADEVAALGRRLFHDARGPSPVYPHFDYQPGRPRVTDSGLADDPDDPARLLPQLEATLAGCQ